MLEINKENNIINNMGLWVDIKILLILIKIMVLKLLAWDKEEIIIKLKYYSLLLYDKMYI